MEGITKKLAAKWTRSVSPSAECLPHSGDNHLSPLPSHDQFSIRHPHRIGAGAFAFKRRHVIFSLEIPSSKPVICLNYSRKSKSPVSAK
jgi:hypothetical protein